MKLIELTQGKVALVDDEDYDFLVQWKWTASFGSRNTKWYAIRRARVSERTLDRNRFRIAMHRFLMKCPEHLVVDHLNSDSLDNRRSNLEVITQEENMKRVHNWKGNRIKIAGSLNEIDF